MEDSTAAVSGTAYLSYPILPFGIVACTVFLTTFLKIAVYLRYVLSNISTHYNLFTVCYCGKRALPKTQMSVTR